jgi:hypothetical protein
MYTFKIETPMFPKSNPHKTAQNNKYSVTSLHGDSVRTMTLSQFCQEQELSMPALIRHVRYWGAGDYTDQFAEVVAAMKRRVRGSYAKHGKKTLCPSCGAQFSRREATLAKRRAVRDASPPNSIWRSKCPEFYGETAIASAAVEPEGTAQPIAITRE